MITAVITRVIAKTAPLVSTIVIALIDNIFFEQATAKPKIPFQVAFFKHSLILLPYASLHGIIAAKSFTLFHDKDVNFNALL